MAAQLWSRQDENMMEVLDSLQNPVSMPQYSRAHVPLTRAWLSVDLKVQLSAGAPGQRSRMVYTCYRRTMGRPRNGSIRLNRDQ